MWKSLYTMKLRKLKKKKIEGESYYKKTHFI